MLVVKNLENKRFIMYFYQFAQNCTKMQLNIINKSLLDNLLGHNFVLALSTSREITRYFSHKLKFPSKTCPDLRTLSPQILTFSLP